MLVQFPRLHAFGPDVATSSSSSAATPSVAQIGYADKEVHRVYDDEDAELQAALRESLRTMPQSYVHPEPAQATNRDDTRLNVTSPILTDKAYSEVQKAETEENDNEVQEDDRSATPPPPPATVDIEEMRRRRLARFG